MHLCPLDGEADAAVLRLWDCWLPVDHLPAPGVGRPVPGPVHRHLDHVLQHGAAQSGGDAGGGAQGGGGVDLQQPRPQVGGQHEVRPVQLVAVLTGTATVHHVCRETGGVNKYFFINGGHRMEKPVSLFNVL